MFKVLVCFLILNLSLLAKDDFLSGKAKFISKDKDGLSFVKKQLLHNAFRDVISKSMTEYGLDTISFWQKFDESLNKKIENFEKTAIQTYTEKGIDDFQDELRKRKLNIKSKFGKLKSLIQSYSVKSFTRSSNNPNYRYMKIEAKVNKDNLSKLYYRYMKSGTSTLVDSLFINVGFTNKLFNYSQIGVDKDSDFTEVIKENWKEWFIKNSPKNIKSIKLLTQNESEEMESLWNKDSEKYKNSLYLKVEVDMRMISFNEELGKYSFSFQTSGILLDIKFKKIIKTFNEKESERIYENIETSKFSSIVANHIYRIPMGKFSRIVSSFKNLRQLENQFDLIFVNYKNLDTLSSLIQELEKKGIKFSLDTNIIELAPNMAKYNVSLNASLKELKDLSISLQSGKKDQIIDIIETSKGLSIKLNKNI